MFNLAMSVETFDEKRNESIAILRKAVQLKPDYVIAHYYLAQALSAVNDIDGAEAEFRKTIELDPTNQYAHNGMGALLINSKNDSVESNPLEPFLLLQLGARLEQRDASSAAAVYRKILAIDSKNVIAWLRLSECLIVLGDLAGAADATLGLIDDGYTINATIERVPGIHPR